MNLKTLGILIGLFISGWVVAGAPLFTFSPLTPTSIQLRPTDTATVQYILENKSQKPHHLLLTPVLGVTQVLSAGHCASPIILGGKQSCVLTLQIQGSLIGAGIHDGPVVCQQGADGNPSPYLCNRPSAMDILNVVVPNNLRTISSSSSGNGSISPNGEQIVYNGSNITLTATPNPNYVVYQWLVDGVPMQYGGANFTLANISANHKVVVTFSANSLFYTGAQNGQVYYSFDQGTNWTATLQMPAAGSSINSLFASNQLLYAAANNFVYLTNNNGGTWTRTMSPDNSAVNTLFVYNNILYVGTTAGSLYYSTNNGASWQPTGPAVDGSALTSLFINANGFYAGTANGNVYYSTNGGQNWTAINGQPDSSVIRSIFVSNNTLFTATSNEFAYSSSSLSGGGTWTLFAQTVYSMFVNPNNNTVYSATQGGYVYSVSDNTALGFVTYSPLNSLFVLN